MQDRPTARELIAAVAQFLSDEVVPVTTDPRLRFRSLIAANLLTIVGREIDGAEPLLRSEWQRLTELLVQFDETTLPAKGSLPQHFRAETPQVSGGQTLRAGTGELPEHPTQLGVAVDAMSRELCARIRAGVADDGPLYAALLAHAEQTVLEKLQIANPKFIQRVS